MTSSFFIVIKKLSDMTYVSSEMWYCMALMPVEMKLGTIHYVTLQGQLCHVLK